MRRIRRLGSLMRFTSMKYDAVNEGDLDDADLRMVADNSDRDDDAHDAPLLAMLEMMPA